MQLCLFELHMFAWSEWVQTGFIFTQQCAVIICICTDIDIWILELSLHILFHGLYDADILISITQVI